MDDDESAFTINDALSTAENLESYAQVLETIDSTLAVALRPHLSGLAGGQSFDKSAVWSELKLALDASALSGIQEGSCSNTGEVA